MSKFSLKKHLQSLTKEQIVEVVLDAYNNSKAVQEYFDFYLQPNEKEKIKKYKAIIEKEFDIRNPMKSGLKYSVAKKAISPGIPSCGHSNGQSNKGSHRNENRIDIDL